MSHHKYDPDCEHCKMIAAGMSEEDARNVGLDRLKAVIQKFGLAITGVKADIENGIPKIFYTVGFTDLDLPEVVFFGINPEYAVPAINRYYSEIKAGKRIPGPIIMNNFFNLPVHVIEADDEAAEMFCHETYAYYEREGKGATPKFVQWVFTDRNGVAPWEEGYVAHFVQPILVKQDEAGINEPEERVIH